MRKSGVSGEIKAGPKDNMKAGVEAKGSTP